MERSVCFFVALAIPQFGLISHISSLRLSSGHSSLVLTLRTNNPACASLHSPHSLLVGVSICATSLLVVAVRHTFCGVFLFLLVMLPSEIPKLSTDMPVRGFLIVWKLLLLHDSLPRTALHP